MLRYVNTFFGLKEDANGDLIKYPHYVTLSLKYDKLVKEYEKLESAYDILEQETNENWYNYEKWINDEQIKLDELTEICDKMCKENKRIIQTYRKSDIFNDTIYYIFSICFFIVGYCTSSIIALL